MRASTRVLTGLAGAAMLVVGSRAGLLPEPAVTFDSGSQAAVVETPTPGPAASTTPDATPTTAAAAGPAATTPTPDPPAPPDPPPAGPTGTFVGPAVRTSYGTMQVQVVLKDGTIVEVQPLVIGRGDGTSVRINQAAVPQLMQRVVAAQSADVSYVSGASYTSQGVLASVRGALANAGA
jgi:uncharacterized protein with FMN-binding domain